MNVGSLFTGIGGFDLGLERAGMRVAWQCEADDFCRRVLAHRWPGVPCYPDVRELHAANVEPVDVLCGGFPCQDISLAGKGAGIDGARSGLWGEYARLIRDLRPRYVVVENVAALLARGLDRVLADLAACGYDAEWDCIPASAVGAPHRRDRVWLVAYPGGEQHEGQGDAFCGPTATRLPQASAAPVADANGGGREPRQPHVQARQPDAEGGGAILADADSAGWSRRWRGRGVDAAAHGDQEDDRLAGGCWARGELQDADGGSVQPWRVGGRAAQAGGPEWWAVEPPVGRVAHGVPDRLVQLAALGNALVPQIAEWLGSRIVEWEGGLT